MAWVAAVFAGIVIFAIVGALVEAWQDARWERRQMAERKHVDREFWRQVCPDHPVFRGVDE